MPVAWTTTQTDQYYEMTEPGGTTIRVRKCTDHVHYEVNGPWDTSPHPATTPAELFDAIKAAHRAGGSTVDGT